MFVDLLVKHFANTTLLHTSNSFPSTPTPIHNIYLQLSLLVLFIICSAAQGLAALVAGEPALAGAPPAAGWCIFVGVIAFLYEIVFIVTRFLIFPILVQYRTIYLFVVSSNFIICTYFTTRL